MASIRDLTDVEPVGREGSFSIVRGTGSVQQWFGTGSPEDVSTVYVVTTAGGHSTGFPSLGDAFQWIDIVTGARR